MRHVLEDTIIVSFDIKPVFTNVQVDKALYNPALSMDLVGSTFSRSSHPDPEWSGSCCDASWCKRLLCCFYLLGKSLLSHLCGFAVPSLLNTSLGVLAVLFL